MPRSNYAVLEHRFASRGVGLLRSLRLPYRDDGLPN